MCRFKMIQCTHMLLSPCWSSGKYMYINVSAEQCNNAMRQSVCISYYCTINRHLLKSSEALKDHSGMSRSTSCSGLVYNTYCTCTCMFVPNSNTCTLHTIKHNNCILCYSIFLLFSHSLHVQFPSISDSICLQLKDR